MKISIFGLGYVGCVSAACLSNQGHTVIGVDINEYKVNLVNQGISPIVEPQLEDLIKKSINEKKLMATTNAIEAVKNTEISLVCVGTPITDTGHLNLEHVFNTVEMIAKALKEKSSFHVIILRSTVPPGTNYKISEIISNLSGKKSEVDFSVVSNPEFLREGNAINDYLNPPYTVIGTKSKRAFEIVKKLYEDLNAPIIKTSIEVAEMIKYVNNTFHALKIVFANEIGNICEVYGIDKFELMDLVTKDNKLNISKAYLKPGMPYGGSCLPKDLSGLIRLASDRYIETPVISSVKKSNELHKINIFNKIIKIGKQNIGIVGLSFKQNTDDLRFSPTVDIVEMLLGKGYNVKIYDKKINISRLIGKNKSYIEEKLPHLINLLYEDENKLLEESDLIVFTQKNEFIENKCKELNKLTLKFYI